MKVNKPGLHSVGNGAWAWLAKNGTWGYSNAGLITDGDASLLIDTLFDLDLTDTMLRAMRNADPAAKNIATVVNTHANGDHCHGNVRLGDVEIIASTASAEEMSELPPDAMAALMASAQEMGPLGQYLLHCFGDFRFDGIRLSPPTRTFDGELELAVGDKTVQLIEVGPAHTRGDVLAYCPADKVVYTGDILFIEGTPIMWEGPIANWINACKHIEAMDVDAIVPGHGPICDNSGVVAVREYLEYVQQQAKIRFDAGMSAFDAAKDIELKHYSDWSEPERIAVNVDSLYREFDQQRERSDIFVLFQQMAELAGFKTQ